MDDVSLTNDCVTMNDACGLNLVVDGHATDSIQR